MASNVRFLDNVSVGSYGGGGGSSISSSYALSSSHADFATSASYADYALSASHEIVKEVSSSYADTASFAQSGNGPFTGSFSGSFIGDGTGLFSGSFSGSIPDAYQIISGSVSASISPDNGLQINSPINVDGNVTASAFKGDGSALTGIVKTTGTPSDNQIAIFTDSNTIEGTSSITYDSTTREFLLGSSFSPNTEGNTLRIQGYNESNPALIKLGWNSWGGSAIEGRFNGTLHLYNYGVSTTPGGRLVLGKGGDTGSNEQNYLWIRGDNQDDSAHIYMGANSTLYASEIGIERQEGTGVNYESDISLRAAAGLSQHKSEYIFSRKGMFQAQDAGFTVSGSGQVFINTTASLINPTTEITGFDQALIVNGDITASGIFASSLKITGSIDVSGSVINNLTSSYAITASHALNTISSSYSNNATSASYAITASHALNGGEDAFPFSGSAEITGSLIISGAGANHLLDVGSGASGKSRLLVTDNSTKYNTFINGELYLGANGVTPQIHFGSDNIIWSMRRNGNQGLTIGNTEFNSGVDVSIYRSLEVGRFIPNSSINKLTVNGSATISGSTGLEVYGSGSTVFNVIGSEGTLLSIDDDLDGTVFTANDRTGFPILEVSASGEVWIGKSPQSLYTTAVISSTTAATTQSIFGLSTSSYDGAFFDYTVQSGSNARAGSIMSVWNGSTINFTETTTTDIGDTTDFNLIVHISQSQAQIASHATNAGYKIKTIIRSI